MVLAAPEFFSARGRNLKDTSAEEEEWMRSLFLWCDGEQTANANFGVQCNLSWLYLRMTDTIGIKSRNVVEAQGAGSHF